jgi:sugar lactone lactonase YvrE
VIVGPQQDANLNRIVELDPATRTLRVIADGLAWPTGVKRAPDGQYYGVDLGAGRVLRIDRSGATPPATVAQFEPGLDNLAVAKDGHVFVSHIPTSSIWDVDPRSGTRRAVVQGHFGVPGGLACRRGPAGDELYLADVFTLKRIDVATRRVTTLVPLDRRSPFPSNVTLAGEHLVASSLFGGTVVVYDRASGRELRRLKDLKAPHDAVELDDGRLLIAEAGARRLTLVARDADLRTRLGDVDDEFMGLARDAAGRWHVGSGGGVLYRIDLAAATLTPVASGLGRIEGLAVTDRGRAFLVVDAASGTLREVTPGATPSAPATVRTRASDLPIGLGAPPELPPGRLFHGVAAGDCRDAYLASDRDATLYRIAPAATSK